MDPVTTSTAEGTSAPAAQVSTLSGAATDPNSPLHQGNAVFQALGISLVFSFISLQALCGTYLPNAPDTSFATIVSLKRGIEIATYLAIALLASRLRNLNARLIVPMATAGCIIAVPLEWAIYSTDSMPLIIHLLVCILTSAGPAILWMAWIELYARMDRRHVLLYYLLANVVAGGITMLCSIHLMHPAMLCLIALMPVVSLVMMRLFAKTLEAAPFAQGEKIVEHSPFPLVPVILSAIFSAANVFARDLLPMEDRPLATLGSIACLVMLLVVYRQINRSHGGIWLIYATAFPLAIASMFGLLLDGNVWGIVATLCAYGADTLFLVFIAVVLCTISYRYGTNALALFGFSQAACAVGYYAGARLSMTFGTTSGNTFVLTVAAIAIALCVVYAVFTSDRSREITWGVESEPARKNDACEMPDGGSTLESIMPEIAYGYGLTKREEEVMKLLYEHRTAAQIEETLVVSNATVKSHTHAVFQKLGVHSRQELIDLLDAKMK